MEHAPNSALVSAHSKYKWLEWAKYMGQGGLGILLFTCYLNCLFLISPLLLQFPLSYLSWGFATVPLPGGLLSLLVLYCYSIQWQIHLLKWFITPAQRAVAVITEQTDLSICCTDIFMVSNRCCGMGSSEVYLWWQKEKISRNKVQDKGADKCKGGKAEKKRLIFPCYETCKLVGWT